MKNGLIILITLLLLVSSFSSFPVYTAYDFMKYTPAAFKSTTGYWSDYSFANNWENGYRMIDSSDSSYSYVENNIIEGDAYLSKFTLDSAPYFIIEDVDVRIKAGYDMAFEHAWSDGTYLFAQSDQNGIHVLEWDETVCETIDFDFYDMGVGDFEQVYGITGITNYLEKTWITGIYDKQYGQNYPTYYFDYVNQNLERVCYEGTPGIKDAVWWRNPPGGYAMELWGISDFYEYIERNYFDGSSFPSDPHDGSRSWPHAGAEGFYGIDVDENWCYSIHVEETLCGYNEYLFAAEPGGDIPYHQQTIKDCSASRDYNDLIVAPDGEHLVLAANFGLELWKHHTNNTFELLDTYNIGSCSQLEKDSNYVYCNNGGDVLVIGISGENIIEVARETTMGLNSAYPVEKNGNTYVFAMRGNHGIDCYKLIGGAFVYLWNYKYGQDGYYVELIPIKNSNQMDTFRFDINGSAEWSDWYDITDYVDITSIGNTTDEYYFEDFYLELYGYKSEDGIYPVRNGKMEGQFKLKNYMIQIRINSTDEPVINLNTSETYESIQPAIDEASPGDHIYCITGTFYEDLTIDKSLTIEGSSIDVIIDGQGDEWGWGDFIDITAEDVTITNITLRNGEINLIDANRGYFTGINFSTTHIQFDESDFCIFELNNFTHYADIGIEDYSNNNTVLNNNFWINTLGWDEPPDGPFTNRWNQTYPGGGNFWEQFPIDYGPGLKDIYSGPNQDIPGSDGIWDEPYELGRDGNKDWYPLVNPVDFDNIPDPPIFSGMTPPDGATNILVTRSFISVYIEDAENETFDWTITGDYVQDTGDIFDTNGWKTATLEDLPYNTRIVWVVTATDEGGDTAISPFSFTTEAYSINEENYVDVDFTPADPEYRKTHWDTLQGAIDTLDDGGTIFIADGTYTENVFIDKSCHLIGADKSTTIIQGEALGGGVFDSTMEVGEVEYPQVPMTKIEYVTFENLTIENEWVAPHQSKCIMLRYVGNIIVHNCDFQYGYEGINVDGDSDNVTITNCDFLNFHQNGIYTGAIDVTIENNLFSDCGGTGVQTGGTNTLIQLNTITLCGAYGVYMNHAENTTITQNEIEDNNMGIGNANSDGSLIYNNNFIDNWQQATDNDGGTGTRWNYTYPTGGNYWSDFDEVSEGAYDRYNGPEQDLSGGDGIVDENSPNPYLIPGGTQQDNYPLIEPWSSAHCMGADFYWTPTYPEPNATVTFYETSCLTDVIEAKWDFGDGTTKTTTKSTIEHSYNKPGYYDVRLTISDLIGNKDSTKKQIYVGYPPHIPPIQPPKYPAGYTIEEMYQLLKADKLSKTMNKVTVMVIDSGVTPRIYNGIDLSKITRMYDPSFTNGNDENGHGTFCCYAIAYILNQKAPNAKIISYKVFDATGATSLEKMLRALDKAKELHVDVVSLSAGASHGQTDDPLSKKCEELRNAGIIVIAAAGNDGPLPSTIMSPGLSDSVISVAGSDPIFRSTDKPAGILDLKDDLIATWSSRGPVKGVYPKPDVTAPGESIRGPWKNTEKVVSGTSMATPLIAGGTAVIIAINKDTIDDVKLKSKVPELYEDAIKETCYKKGEANDWGAGIVQFDALSENFKKKLDDYILWEQNLIMYFCWLLLLIIIAIIIYYYYKKRKQKKNHLPKWFK